MNEKKIMKGDINAGCFNVTVDEDTVIPDLSTIPSSNASPPETNYVNDSSGKVVLYMLF